MGQAIVNGRMNVENVGRAILKVTTNYSTTVTCKMGSSIMKKTSTATDNVVEFNVYFGSWEVSATIEGKLMYKTINIEESKIYTLSLTGFTYGVQFDMSTTDYTATYIDDAEGFEPYVVGGSNPIWDVIITDFIGCKPCMVKDGVRTKYLQVDDYTKYEDGSDADITTGDEGIAMVEFKKNWYKYSVENDILKFEVANYDRSADGFVQDAFKSIDDYSVIKDYLYYSVFPCSGLSGTNGYETLGFADQLSAITKTNGSSYMIEDWTRRMYISGLLMLLMKDTDPKFGITSDSSGYSYSSTTKTGVRNKNGLFYNQSNVPKILGIEGLITGTNGGEIFPINGLMSGQNHSEHPYLRYRKYPPYGEFTSYTPNIQVVGEGNGDLYIAKVYSPDASMILPSVLSSASPGISGSCNIFFNNFAYGGYSYYHVSGLFGVIHFCFDNTSATYTKCTTRKIMV